jgi:hypothetical protein
MPSNYGDLSRIALETDLDVDELRARLARMDDRALREYGRAAAYMCTPYANLGQPPRKPFVLQLEAARAERPVGTGPHHHPQLSPCS